MTSSDYLNQIKGMGTMPDYRTQVTQAYETPVLKPLVQERANLEQQYLPTLFEPLAQMGTGASDMSPAAKLALLGGSIGRLQSRIGANQNIQNFYGTQISDIANRAAQDWQNRNQSLWQQYQAQAAAEQAAKDEAFRYASLNASKQGPTFPTNPNMGGGQTNNPNQIQALVAQARAVKQTLSSPAFASAISGATRGGAGAQTQIAVQNYRNQYNNLLRQLQGYGVDINSI